MSLWIIVCFLTFRTRTRGRVSGSVFLLGPPLCPFHKPHVFFIVLWYSPHDEPFPYRTFFSACCFQVSTAVGSPKRGTDIFTSKNPNGLLQFYISGRPSRLRIYIYWVPEFEYNDRRSRHHRKLYPFPHYPRTFNESGCDAIFQLFSSSRAKNVDFEI